ncbi:MAG: hypothetical protein M3081_15660 [Gemmatimonadota bacterium]|nr:hypothetical protein [Gemmatimonadota bacterium]
MLSRSSCSARFARALIVALPLALIACTDEGESKTISHRDTVPSVVARADSNRRDSTRKPLVTGPRVLVPHRPKLSPLADSIAPFLVFHAQNLQTLTVASREGHFLLDIGRADTKLTTPARLQAFREAVTALAPVHIGERFRVRGPWGAVDATVSGFESYSNRITALLTMPPAIDTMAKRKLPVTAAATRATTAQADEPAGCVRDAGPEIVARAKSVKDSIARAIRFADTTSLPERLSRSRRVQSSIAYGCFGGAKAMVLVAIVAGDYEYGREVVALIDSAGYVSTVKMADSRFRVHELTESLDADGDGVDDVAVKGKGIGIGDTAILRLDRKTGRLERLTGGFSWEAM